MWNTTSSSRSAPSFFWCLCIVGWAGCERLEECSTGLFDCAAVSTEGAVMAHRSPASHTASHATLPLAHAADSLPSRGLPSAD